MTRTILVNNERWHCGDPELMTGKPLKQGNRPLLLGEVIKDGDEKFCGYGVWEKIKNGTAKLWDVCIRTKRPLPELPCVFSFNGKSYKRAFELCEIPDRKVKFLLDDGDFSDTFVQEKTIGYEA